tara:strand:- start:7734 stop:8987 length:1254 start_codon:yes stop_codon:yes gene_type:complete
MINTINNSFKMVKSKMDKNSIVIVADSFYPDVTSVSVQIQDLVNQYIIDGYRCYVILPSNKINTKNFLKKRFKKNITLIYLKTFDIKNKSYILRALSEFVMPFLLKKNFNKELINKDDILGIISYSPSIFFGFFISYLKKIYNCKSYLIARDLFPRWAADLNLIKFNSIEYYFLDFINNYQYKIADHIGIQSKGNLSFFNNKYRDKIEILPNWLNTQKKIKKNINSNLINKLKNNKKIIVTYTGNIGIAQGFKSILDMILQLKNNNKIYFVVFGRGDNFYKLDNQIKNYKLKNIYLSSEISSELMDEIYDISNIGLVSLDVRHTTHNIPGKFINYLKSGLPVFVKCNKTNDLFSLVNNNSLGCAVDSDDSEYLKNKLLKLANEVVKKNDYHDRCKKFFKKNYDVRNISKQILKKLNI